ncbi:MAG: glycosyltransferase [Lachnospiraceae bacterium]|nr:glycosyltransferase [Lachnospiraceae bacterium]
MKKVSVIIPVYNKVEYLRECLDSVLSQTLDDIEVICVDDGSTDGSLEILSEYVRGGHIRLLVQENSGAGMARNNGIENAEGEFLSFIDADDTYYDKEVLEKLYYAAKRNEVTLCAGGLEMFDTNGRKYPYKLNCYSREGIYRYDSDTKIYGQTSFLYSKELLDSNGIRYPSYCQFEDPPFLLKAIIAAKCYYAITDYVYCYRVGYKNRSTSEKKAVDILSGVRDCFEMASRNMLYNLYNVQLKNLLFDLLEYYYSYAICGNAEIIDLLDSIGEYYKKISLNTDLPLVYDYQSFTAYTNNVQETIQRINSRRVIVYGIGNTARKAFASGVLKVDNVIGFAKSQLDEDDELFLNHTVRSIYECNSSEYVVVCANGKNQDNMKKILNDCGFSDYCCIDNSFIMICNELIK